MHRALSIDIDAIEWHILSYSSTFVLPFESIFHRTKWNFHSINSHSFSWDAFFRSLPPNIITIVTRLQAKRIYILPLFDLLENQSVAYYTFFYYLKMLWIGHYYYQKLEINFSIEIFEKFVHIQLPIRSWKVNTLAIVIFHLIKYHFMRSCDIEMVTNPETS